MIAAASSVHDEADVAEKRIEHRDVGLSGIAVSSDRMRTLRPEVVKELASSMRKQGLLQPILLRPTPGVGNGYFLIAGAHRYHAAKKLGWQHIPARIFHGWSDADALLAEIDENLCRAELTAAQRAKFTAERKKVYLKAHPETRKGGDRQTHQGKQSAKSALSFVNDTAAKTGRSKRAIETDVARAEALGDDIDRVAGTSLDKGTELDALAVMPPEVRAPIIQRAASGEEISAIRSALAQEPRPGYSDLRRSWKSFSAAWRRAKSPSTKDAFVEDFRDEISNFLGAPPKVPTRGREAVKTKVLNALAAMTGLPPTDEVVQYFSGDDAALLIREQLPSLITWLGEFALEPEGRGPTAPSEINQKELSQ